MQRSRRSHYDTTNLRIIEPRMSHIRRLGTAHRRRDRLDSSSTSIIGLPARHGCGAGGGHRGKASNAPSGSKQAIPGGMTLDECSVVLSGAGSTHPVSIRIVSDLGMDGAQAIKIRNTGQAREAQWKTAGARLEQSTVGTALCIRPDRPTLPHIRPAVFPVARAMSKWT